MSTDTLIATDVDVFNKLFKQLANQEDHVCWVRSLDFERQLYLSPQFEKVFGRPVETLYNNPNAWYDFLLTLDNKDMTKVMPKRIKNPILHNGENVVYYRIATPSGETRYIRDWSILLRDKEQNICAVAGVAERLTAETWYTEQDNQNQVELTTSLTYGKSLAEILQEEKKLHIIDKPQQPENIIESIKQLNINGMNVTLSQREAECLNYLCLGKSAKETAKALYISPRTVETHLDNIKQKTFCKSKLQLMSYVIQSFIQEQ